MQSDTNRTSWSVILSIMCISSLLSMYNGHYEAASSPTYTTEARTTKRLQYHLQTRVDCSNFGSSKFVVSHRPPAWIFCDSIYSYVRILRTYRISVATRVALYNKRPARGRRRACQSAASAWKKPGAKLTHAWQLRTMTDKGQLPSNHA